MHSAFDLSPKLYNFAQWLNSPEFVSPKKGYTGVEASSDQPPVQEQAALNLSMSLIFANYNSTNGMGCGLQTLEDISKGTIIIKQKTAMGLISGEGLYDRLPSQQTEATKEETEMDVLNSKIEHITRKLSNGLFPGNPVQANRLY